MMAGCTRHSCARTYVVRELYVVREKRGHQTEPYVMAAAAERFVAWCKQEQASIQQQLELRQSGKVLTEEVGEGWQ